MRADRSSIVREQQATGRLATRAYGGLLRTLGRTRLFAWLGARLLHRLDLSLARFGLSPSGLGTGLPLCFLTVPGRRSGIERTVPLLHLADDDRVVLVASNWGRREHPAWALNLEAAGEATIRVWGVERRLRPRRATADEVERYWPEVLRVWPGYDAYRRRAHREIRVFVLEPQAGG